MDIKRIILSRILPVGALAFMIVAAVAYQKGVYDITFIERPKTVSTSVTETAETERIPETEYVETTSEAINLPETATQNSTDPVAEYVSTLGSTAELTAAGFSITSDEYSDDFVISRLTPALTVTPEFSKRTRMVETYVRIPDDTYNTYSTETREISEDIPNIEVYMDYILVDNGETVDVLRNDGTLLMSALDTSVYVPAYTRDKQNNPVFKAKEPSKYYPKNIITNYYYINADGSLKSSTYIDENDGRGLYVNYPSNFGTTDTSLYLYYSKTNELYGYGSVNGNMRTEYKYSHAFNYSEKLACAVETDGLMYFINDNLISKISGSVQVYKNYNSARRRLLREYVMPDTFGEESLGFFYFDHGLVRVRCQVVDAYHWIERQKRYTASDEDILIRADGTQFPLPSDYKLIAYSNGIILLEKNGKYGYMNYTGKWILEPVYTMAKPFYEGLAVVGDGTKVGMINTTGEFVIPMIFDHIGNASGGVISAWSKDHGWTLLNKLVSPKQ